MHRTQTTEIHTVALIFGEPNKCGLPAIKTSLVLFWDPITQNFNSPNILDCGEEQNSECWAEQHDLLVRIDLLRVQGPVDWANNTIVTIRLLWVWVLITPAALDLPWLLSTESSRRVDRVKSFVKNVTEMPSWNCSVPVLIISYVRSRAFTSTQLHYLALIKLPRIYEIPKPTYVGGENMRKGNYQCSQGTLVIPLPRFVPRGKDIRWRNPGSRNTCPS